MPPRLRVGNRTINFDNLAPGADELDELIDVDVETALSGSVLAFDGIEWTATSINFLNIESGSITTDKLADGAVTFEKLSSSGVLSGTYGSSVEIPVISIDEKGRVIDVTTSAITGGLGATGPAGPTGPTGATGPTGPAGLSTGAAGGDLTGNYPNPSVRSIGGNDFASELLSPSDAGKAMIWDGTQWEAQSVPSLAPSSANNITVSGDYSLQEWIDTNWSPLLIPDLQLFLDSSVGVTTDGNGKVVTWHDRSAASRTFSQNDPTKQPLLTSGSLAGKPVVTFSGNIPLSNANSMWMRSQVGSGFGISSEGITLVTVLRSDAPALLAANGGYQQIIGTIQASGPGWTYSTRGIYGLPQAQLAVTAPTAPDGFVGFGAGVQNYQGTDAYSEAPLDRPGLWHISAVSINPSQNSSWVDRDDAIAPATITSTPYIVDPFAQGNFANLIQYGDQPGQLLEIGRTTQADVRFILLFNRSLNQNEMKRLKNWLKAEINRDQEGSRDWAINENVLFVSQDGEDSNRGANEYESLRTMSEVFKRLNHVPYNVEGLRYINQPSAADSQTFPSRVVFVGPGTFALPKSISRVSNLMIAGTVEIDHTFQVVSATGGGSEQHPLKIIINETVANDAWRGKQITLFDDGNTAVVPWNIPYTRYTIAKNVDNGDGTTTLYVPSAGVNEIPLPPGTQMGLLNHLTELVWEGGFSYIEINNCQRLQIANCIIRNDFSTDGGVLNGARADVWNAYFVLAGVIWKGINLMAAGGSHLVVKNCYIAPKAGTWAAFFCPMIRWGGIMESHSNVFDYRYAAQYRMQLAQGGLNLFGGQIIRQCQGVVFTGHTNYPPRGNVNVLFIESVYGFWADQSRVVLPPITFENRIDPGQDVMWDYAASGGSTIKINAAPGFIADPKINLNAYPVNQKYRTATMCVGGFTGVDTFAYPYESATSPSNSVIYCDEPSIISRSPRDYTNITLLNSWQSVNAYMGTWDISSNTPDIAALATTPGQTWVSSVTGIGDLGGIGLWNKGDYAVYEGAETWSKSAGDPPVNMNPAPSVAKTSSGIVQMRGVISGGSTGTVFTNIPEGLRPSSGWVGQNEPLVYLPMTFTVPTDSGTATIRLSSNGDMTVVAMTSGSQIFLDSISWISH